jgi:hypothetical protein
MRQIPIRPVRTIAVSVIPTLLVACMLGFAQDQSNEQPPADTSSQDQAPPPASQDQTPASPQDQTPPTRPGWHRFSKAPQAPDQNSPSDPPANEQQSRLIPAQLTLKSGTFLTVRIDQFISSDRNKAGDAFTASLAKPVVVDGVVVAQGGQTVAGRVVEAQKAGRVKGVSRLAIQLTDLSIADGQQVPIRTQLIGETGPTSKGRDAVAIGTTTGVGASIGAAADWGEGAAIGAGAGALAGTIGVLLTRGRPTIIYPETVMTFRLADPVTISTERAPEAFSTVGTSNYSNYGQDSQSSLPPANNSCDGYGCAPPTPYPYYGYPYYASTYYPYYYPYYYYPYYWGPSFSFWFGPRYYYGRGFYGRGFYGRGYYGRGYYGHGFYGRGYYGGGFGRGYYGHGFGGRGYYGGGFGGRGYYGGGGGRGFGGGGGYHGGGGGGGGGGGHRR